MCQRRKASPGRPAEQRREVATGLRDQEKQIEFQEDMREGEGLCGEGKYPSMSRGATIEAVRAMWIADYKERGRNDENGINESDKGAGIW